MNASPLNSVPPRIAATEVALERSIDQLHGTIALLCEANDCDPRLIAESEVAIRQVISRILLSAWALEHARRSIGLQPVGIHSLKGSR